MRDNKQSKGGRKRGRETQEESDEDGWREKTMKEKVE